MKKVLTILVAMLLFAGPCFAAGTVTQTMVSTGTGAVLVVFTCTGDASDGSTPDTDISAASTTFLKNGNYYLVDVIAFPTPSGTAPDAADITVKPKSYPTKTSAGAATTIAPAVPRDILGGYGVNLLHATDEQSLGPSMPVYELVTGVLTLAVANQATVSAHFTIVLKFEK